MERGRCQDKKQMSKKENYSPSDAKSHGAEVTGSEDYGAGGRYRSLTFYIEWLRRFY